MGAIPITYLVGKCLQRKVTDFFNGRVCIHRSTAMNQSIETIEDGSENGCASLYHLAKAMIELERK